MKKLLYGVKLAILEELDPKTELPKDDGTPIRIDTAETVGMEAVTSEGAEDVKRIDDRILAIATTNDLLYGYDLTLTDNLFDTDVVSLVEGANTKAASGSSSEVVSTPLLSEGFKGKYFRLTLYSAHREGNSIIDYAKITFNKCHGIPSGMSLEKAFYSPEFTIKAREASKAKLPIRSIEIVKDLPTDTSGTLS